MFFVVQSFNGVLKKIIKGGEYIHYGIYFIMNGSL